MATTRRRHMEVFDRKAVRRALIAERMQIHHYQMALDSTTDRRLRRHCGALLKGSLNRAADLALALIDMGESVLTTSLGGEADTLLLAVLDADVCADGAAAVRARRRTRSEYAVPRRGRGGA